VTKHLQGAIERSIRIAKGDPSYSIGIDYGTADLLEIGWRRTMEVLRGTFIRRKLRRSSGLLFAGRGVTIRHGRHVTAGRSLQIGDGVLIDGLSTHGIHLGANVNLVRGCTLVATGVVARPGHGIVIGDRSAIGDHSYIGGQGGVEIGSDVLLGPAVRIFSENHAFANPDVLIRAQGEERARVVVEDDCWLGAGCTILAGVTVHRGSVVAAGAVVVRDVPPRAVVAGVPARVVSTRDAAAAPPVSQVVPGHDETSPAKV
jgi:acetyltransferase-like isoleucine patch superfamily enzyme